MRNLQSSEAFCFSTDIFLSAEAFNKPVYVFAASLAQYSGNIAFHGMNGKLQSLSNLWKFFSLNQLSEDVLLGSRKAQENALESVQRLHKAFLNVASAFSNLFDGINQLLLRACFGYKTAGSACNYNAYDSRI